MVKGGNLITAGDLHSYLKDMFKDILQEMLEAELGVELGYVYGIELSAEMVSKITDNIISQIKEWQNRPLEAIYSFVVMDAIHYKVREDGQIKNKAAYVVLGVNLDGFKDIEIGT